MPGIDHVNNLTTANCHFHRTFRTVRKSNSPEPHIATNQSHKVYQHDFSHKKSSGYHALEYDFPTLWLVIFPEYSIPIKMTLVFQIADMFHEDKTMNSAGVLPPISMIPREIPDLSTIELLKFSRTGVEL